MLQKYNKWKVLRIIFEDPLPEGGGFQLRELSRKAKLAPTSVKSYLQELIQEGLVSKSKHRIHSFPLYSANRENEKFAFYKKLNTIASIAESGLLSYLQDTCMPSAIVLFGSAAKGEDVKGSDMDIFLLCSSRKLELEKYENKLGRRINVLFTNSFHELSSELKNNIINGVKLKGYLKAFK